MYYHQVIEQGPGTYRKLYEGHGHADAMAAWSKAISDGVEYVTLESLLVTSGPPPRPVEDVPLPDPPGQA